MSGDPYNSYQRIPEISIKETKYKKNSREHFFCMRKIGKRNYFVQDEFQKFHHY